MVDRYEIDEKHEIVDFYIEGEDGREHHTGMSFYATLQLARKLISEISRAS